MFDWSDGSYEDTATALAPAAAHLVEVTAPRGGEDALDLGCGTGTAARLLAARGARVVGVDPARRLLDVAKEDVPGADFREGTAEAIPAEDDAFDLVIASFSLIFTPDPARAAAEIVRVLRPGGRLVASSWVPEGGIHEASAALMEVMARYFPGGGTRPPWGDPAFFRALFDGAQVTRGELVFEAPSAARWFADQEDRHPAWRAARAALAPFPEAWPEVRARSVGALERASVGSDSLRVVSGFWVVRVVVGGMVGG